MSMTDPIADMLTRIRNACTSKHRRVDMPASKMKIEIARLLKENNFVQDYRLVETEEGRQLLRVVLKYAQGGTPVIREVERAGTAGGRRRGRGRRAGGPGRKGGRPPGRRKYVGVTEIPRVRNGLGMAILSTSQGVLSDRQARTQRTGGELLALVW